MANPTTAGQRLWLGLRVLYWLLVLLIGALIGMTLARTTHHPTRGEATLDRQAAATCVTFGQWLQTGGTDQPRRDALRNAAAAFVSGPPQSDTAGLPSKYAALGTHINAALAAVANHSAVSLQRRGRIVLDECTTILTTLRG
jgi:hypothetical protein